MNRRREKPAPRPEDAQALMHNACIAGQQNEFDRAALLLQQILKSDQGNALAHMRLGVALRGLRRPEEALASLDRSIELQPDLPDAHFGRGDVLADLRRWEEALASYDAAIALAPQQAVAHCNRGNVLREIERWEESLLAYDRALDIEPNSVTLLSNRGVVLNDLHRFEEAASSFDRALDIDPEYATARFNRGILRLSQGRYREGWLDYECRWEDPAGSVYKERRPFAAPRWSGTEPLAGRKIFVYGEQGYGDVLQFCRYVKLLADQDARVILEARPPLLALLADLEGVWQLVRFGQPLPEFDFHCPLMSLPLAFGTTLETIPPGHRYLSADSLKVAQWRETLQGYGRWRVGLTWSGNAAHVKDRHRSIELARLLQGLPRGVQYVSLQNEIRETDRTALASHPDLLNVADRLRDFSDTAALCECLDLIISVDTSVVHLAGALGKPTWVLVAANHDWRWLLDRGDSPWYPSVNLYRQTILHDWAPVLERVTADMARCAGLKDGF